MICVTPISSSLEQDTILLTAIWRWWRQTSCYWCQAPFFDVCLDEHKSTLAEIYVDVAGAVGTNRRKEVLRFQTMYNIIQLFTVSRKKYRPRSRSIANSDYITLNIFGPVSGGGERLVIPPEAV